MKCKICGSETPPHYQHIGAIICHTCKSLGQFVKGLVVDSKPPDPEIEPPKTEESEAAPAQERPVQAPPSEETTTPNEEATQESGPEQEDPLPLTMPTVVPTKPKEAKKTTKLK